MASRTNKRWIAKIKAQLEKQARKRPKWAKRFEYPKRKLELQEAKELWVVIAKTNPKWNTYHRFLRWRKVCWETRLRMDPDWFRLIKTPSWSLEFVEVPMSGWLRKKIMKRARRR